MESIKSPEALQEYVVKYHLEDIFSCDLSQIATVVTYHAHEQIYRAGSRAQMLLVLVDGECLAYVINSVGKIHSELHYSGLNIMGLVSVLWDEPVINDIVALTDCTFLYIPADRFRSVLLQDVKFLNYAVRWLGNHIRKNESHFEPLNTRLASFILQTERDDIFQPNMTVCADILETSYRHLMRTLRGFCDMGLLGREKRGRYRILSRQGLLDIQRSPRATGRDRGMPT